MLKTYVADESVIVNKGKGPITRSDGQQPRTSRVLSREISSDTRNLAEIEQELCSHGHGCGNLEYELTKSC